MTSAYLSGIPFTDSNRPGEIISPMIINAYSAMTVPAYWRAINFLADNLSSFPRSIRFKGTPAANHPMNKMLGRKPNAYQNSTQLWRTFFGHAGNYGNGYIQIFRDAVTGRATSLHNRLPEDVWPFRYLHEGDEQPTQYYYIRTSKQIVHGEDMLHISALSYDGMSGHNVVWMHRESLQRSLTLDMFMTKYLQKGTVIRGVIEIPSGVDDKQVTDLESRLRTHFHALNGDKDILTLSDGATLKNTTLSPDQSKLIEMGAYSVKQIAQVTGVPPQFLYEFSEQKYNGASVEAMGQDVVRFTFRPWIEQTEDDLTLKLLSEAEQDQGYTVHIDPNALIRGDTATTTNTAVAKANAGIITPNEARQDIGYAPSNDPAANKLKTLGDTTPQSNRLPASPGDTPVAPSKQNAKLPAAETFAAGAHKFATTQIDLPTEVAEPMLEMARTIPAGDLAEDGVETDPHVTLKYGLHSDEPGEIIRLMADESPFEITMGDLTLFEATDLHPYDVLKIEIEGDDLHRLHGKIKAGAANTETHPTYQPHATIAYLKPGEGKKYVGKSPVSGKKVTVSAITFSATDGTCTTIKLAGEKDAGYAVKEHLQLSHFAALIQDAADRVHKKTDKAIESAKKKFSDNPAGWIPWANVFAKEQEHYSASALAPVFKTYSNLSGKPTDGVASRCGSQYARQLSQHLSNLYHSLETAAPDLAAIALLLGAQNGPDPVANQAI